MLKKSWLIKVGFHNFMISIITKKLKKSTKNKKDVIYHVSTNFSNILTIISNTDLNTPLSFFQNTPLSF